MENHLESRRIWNHLLSSGGYSIGYFSVTVAKDHIRVFHYRSKEVTYLAKEQSFEEMNRLCRKRGYELSTLLNHYYPKSFRSLRMANHIPDD